LVEALAQNADGALRPGMFATVQVSLGDESIATVPDDAIVKDGTVNRLYLARDGQAFEMVVRIGVSHAGRTAVLDELADKTPVIRHPPASLRDGTKVRIVSGDGAPSHAVNGDGEPTHAVASPTPPTGR
jgi:membrane fusion protein (multidrug efflux system)